MAEDDSQQRLDKWLWFARVMKTRTLASRLVGDGKVRLNRERTDKPSQSVRVGDVVTATVRRRVRVLRVLALGKRRGPASEASDLFEDLTPVQERPQSSGVAVPTPDGAQTLANARTPGSGRPTKRERRDTDRLKGSR